MLPRHSRALPVSPRFARTLVATATVVAVSVSSLSANTTLERNADTFPSRASGVTFKYNISSSITDKNRKNATDMNTTVRMQGGRIRMDYTSGGPMGQKDAYVLVDGKAGTFSIVNPKDKAVMVMDAGTFGSGAGAMLNNPLVKMNISNQSFRFQDMGAGEPMLGYKTRRLRLWHGSTMEIKMLGKTNRTTSSDSSDQWIAQGIDADNESLEAWGRSFASGVKSTAPQLAAEITRYQKEYGRSGIALRTVTWSTVTDDKGKATSDSMLMQVTDITKGNISADVFEIPANYTVTNVGEMMAAAKTSMDSAKRADAAAGKDTGSVVGAAKAGAKEGAKEGAKDAAKDAMRQGIGGLLRKKKGV